MDCMNEMNVVTPSEARIATLAAAAGAEVWAYRQSDNELFKFKFGEGVWSPPFAADEAIKFLNEEMRGNVI